MNLYEQAKSQHLAGEVKEAIALYQRHLKDEPRSVETINMLGNAFLDLGRVIDAIVQYDRALDIDPTFADAHYNLGNTLCIMGKPDAAVGAYRRALNNQPEFFDALFNLGNAHLDLDQSEEAIEAYRSALAIDSENGATHFNLGKALRALNRHDEACDAFRRAMEIDPDQLRTCSELGQMMIQTGKPEEALEYFTKASSIDPDQPSEHFNIAMALFVLGRAEESEASFRRTLEIDPKSGRVYECLGRLLIQVGRLPEAIELIEKWIELEPEDPRAKHLKAAWTGRECPERASDDFIRQEFDHLADSFDLTLRNLDYQAPGIVADVLNKAREQDAIFNRIIDVGCGTGLCGTLLKPMTRHLIGVDLSEQMLLMAKRTQDYDELENAELTEFLAEKCDTFDAIVSSDTFNYFGDLAPVFIASWKALVPNGLLVFTAEYLAEPVEESPYHLMPSGRYSHTDEYLSGELSRAGFTLESSDQVILRTEGGEPVKGFVMLARKHQV